MSPRLRSQYVNSPSVRRFAWKNLLFGYSKVVVWQKHPQVMSWRHFVSPLFVAGLAFGPLLWNLHWFFQALWVIGVSSYATACLGVAAFYLMRGAGRAAILLPLVFVLLHLCWGAGFLAGAVRFFPRWFRHEPAPPALSTKPTAMIQKGIGFAITERP